MAIGTGLALGMAGAGAMGAFVPGSSADRQREAQNRFQEFLANMNRQDYLAPGLMSDISQRQGLSQQLGSRGVANFRPEMRQHIWNLQRDAAGFGPGQELVRRQVGGQVQSGIQNQLAMAAGQRGNPLAARTAAMQGANISAQGGQAAAMGGLQAQLAARGQLGQALGQERSLSQQGQLEALRQQMNFRNMLQQGRQAYMGAQLSGRGALAGMKGAPSDFQAFAAGLGGAGEIAAAIPGSKNAKG